MPVVFDSAVLNRIDPLADDSWYVVSQADVIGFGVSEISAQLGNHVHGVVAKPKKARLVSADAAAETRTPEQRHPILRVLWRPDAYGLGLMPTDQVTKHPNSLATKAHSDISDEGLLDFRAALHLLSHKNQDFGSWRLEMILRRLRKQR